MMKYIFCILVGILLIGGFNSISNEVQQAYRSKTGSSGIQTCIRTHYSKSKATIAQLGKGKKLAKPQEYTGRQDYKTNNGILNPFSFRHFSPLKILRFNIPSATIRILSALKVQVPQNQWTGFSYYINLIKYSYRYHIYTLGRILI